MPTISAHVTEEEEKAVELAVAASEEKKMAPYVKEAVFRRMAREGMLPGNPRAEINAAIEEVGVEHALELLRKASRRKGAQVRTVAA